MSENKEPRGTRCGLAIREMETDPRGIETQVDSIRL
jgi:hypothetical protein